MGREGLNKVLQNVVFIGQLGLSFIMPILLCIALSWYLNSVKGVGVWIYIPCFIFGIGGSFVTAYKFYLSVMKKEKKEEKKKTVSFNRHI